MTHNRVLPILSKIPSCVLGRYMRLFFLMLFTAWCLAGCSVTPAQPDSYPFGLNVGDDVIITTKNSSEYKFTILEITDSSIVGKSVVLPKEEIDFIRLHDGDVIYRSTTKKFSDFTAGVFGAITLVMILVTPFIFN